MRNLPLNKGEDLRIWGHLVSRDPRYSNRTIQRPNELTLMEGVALEEERINKNLDANSFRRAEDLTRSAKNVRGPGSQQFLTITGVQFKLGTIFSAPWKQTA